MIWLKYDNLYSNEVLRSFSSLIKVFLCTKASINSSYIREMNLQKVYFRTVEKLIRKLDKHKKRLIPTPLTHRFCRPECIISFKQWCSLVERGPRSRFLHYFDLHSANPNIGFIQKRKTSLAANTSPLCPLLCILLASGPSSGRKPVVWALRDRGHQTAPRPTPQNG